MTPQQLITSALRMYNSAGSGFYSDDELLDYIYFAELDMANKTYAIQNTYSTTTTAGLREYAFPMTALAIKKVTYDGVPLKLTTLGEDDVITNFHEDTVATGSCLYYSIWDNIIALRPIPSDAKTLKVWTYNLPQKTLISSVLETPEQYHPGLIYYILAQMVRKDENYNLAQVYDAKWDAYLAEVDRDVQKQKRADSYAQVKDDESGLVI